MREQNKTKLATKYSSLIISNRLPISVVKENENLYYHNSSGGLATAMSSLDDEDRLWIGWPGISSDDITEAEKELITKELLKQACYPVFLSNDQVENFYEGYSNDTLWPLFHYFQSLTEHDENYWKTYNEVNKLFSSVTVSLAKENAKIWIHDYHLLLLPGLIRNKLQQATIGFFLHIPFPSYEIFRQLPNRHEILQGMLGADLIGFHIYDYARHFLSSAARIEAVDHSHGLITYQGRRLVADTFPIGVDYTKIVDSLDKSVVKSEIKKIKQHYKNQKIIISVDRLDYSKGILQRLDAFELFLEEHPEFHKKIALSMIAVPSRTDVETYQNLRDTIELSISRINGQYALVDWTPISYQFKNQPFEKVIALYAAADIALVTPLRDGMNLVAKEFVAAKQDLDGVLILSELAGAIDELPEAISINPNSIRSIKNALIQALSMKHEEKAKRLKTMQQRIQDYDVKDWAEDFLSELDNVKLTQAEHEEKILNKELQKIVKRSFKLADKRLLIFDYDGTLHEFVDSTNHTKATPSKDLLTIIKKLSKIDNTVVCIVSGRPKEALDSWFEGLNVLLVAEHGAWIKINGVWNEEQTSFDDHRAELIGILKKYAKRTTGATVEEKSNAIVWHYRRVKPELAYARNVNLTKDIKRYIKDTDLAVFHGNKIIEIKPETINKGVVAEMLYDTYQPDFVLCIGDDYTDEDMFYSLPEHSYTIKVGLEETEALFQLKKVADVHQLLKFLLS
jgi:trehalose 6-phosphate synthase/phosphatase